MLRALNSVHVVLVPGQQQKKPPRVRMTACDCSLSGALERGDNRLCGW